MIASWLLDLTARTGEDPDLSKFAGRVSDSGEGRWTIKAAIDEAVPAPVLTAALYERFSSRGEADFADKFCRQCALNLADIWKSPKISRKWLKEMNVTNPHSDALVFFGATGTWLTRKFSRRCRRW